MTIKKFNRWNVRVIATGDKYGLNDCLTYDDSSPQIEFYDDRNTNKTFGERGIFITRYYVSTFLDGYASGVRLCLNGGIPEWTVESDDYSNIVNWVNELK